MRSREGDQRAFAELVRRYQDVSFRVAYVVTGSAEEAEDATQEGFVRAHRGLHRFRCDAPFRPWLLTIVANVARSRRSRVERRLSLLTAASDAASVTDDPRHSPESLALADEQVNELLTAVARLRHDDQQVITLRYFLDLSEAEMANVLGCARGTVKSRLSRALGRLRAELAAERDCDG